MSNIISVRLPEDWIEAIDRAAAKAGQKRNTWIANTLRAALPATRLSELQTPGGARRTAKPAPKKRPRK